MAASPHLLTFAEKKAVRRRASDECTLRTHMSLLDASCIRVIAESVGIAQVSDEVAEALAPDVEYRLRDIVQACSRSVVRERASHPFGRWRRSRSGRHRGPELPARASCVAPLASVALPSD